MDHNYRDIVPFIARRGKGMNQRDLNAVISVAPFYLDREVDLIEWTNILVMYGIIDQNKRSNLNNKLVNFEGSRSMQFSMFLAEILGFISFDDLVNIMYRQGLNDFAAALNTERYGHVLGRMGRADVPHGSYILKFYFQLKRNIDNGVFNDPKLYLKNLARDLTRKIEEYCLDAEGRQFNAEKLVAVYVSMLPQYRKHRERKAILDEMNRFFHRTDIDPQTGTIRHLPPLADSNSADIVYASKMAVTESIAGDFDKALAYIMKAEFLGSLYKPSFAGTLAYHDHQLIFLQEYMRTRQAGSLGQVLIIGDRGLRVLTEEHDDVRNQWSRLFMLYKVMSLLGVTSDFRVTDGYAPEKNIEHAKEVLKEIRGSFEGIEVRREMIYNLCMGRVHELSDLDTAITYVKEAIRLANEWGDERTSFIPNEKANIRAYLKKLKARLKKLKTKPRSTSLLNVLYDIHFRMYLQIFVVVAFAIFALHFME